MEFLWSYVKNRPFSLFPFWWSSSSNINKYMLFRGGKRAYTLAVVFQISYPIFVNVHRLRGERNIDHQLCMMTQSWLKPTPSWIAARENSRGQRTLERISNFTVSSDLAVLVSRDSDGDERHRSIHPQSHGIGLASTSLQTILSERLSWWQSLGRSMNLTLFWMGGYFYPSKRTFPNI